MTGIRIRQERDGDSASIRKVVKTAFANVPESDHTEQHLVDGLHESATFVPRLSLVAQTDDGKIVGYILLTEVEIVSPDNEAVTSLAVAPLAVLPDCQRRGIGGMLLRAAHRTAASLGYGTAVLLGHKDYYPRFGYRPANDFGIEFPFDVSNEYCMVVELLPGALVRTGGKVRYPDIFYR